VGDEHDRHPVFPLELAHQLEICSGGHVSAVVGSSAINTWMHERAHRDHGPLTQAAAQLTGELVHSLLRR